mmetsp:Transcript_43281/g.108129  ORF Transcript_43281/g.108129 Transcript_43281/m.108129 type:complete len:293 (-) Transcript_43281:13-891(-)
MAMDRHPLTKTKRTVPMRLCLTTVRWCCGASTIWRANTSSFTASHNSHMARYWCICSVWRSWSMPLSTRSDGPHRCLVLASVMTASSSRLTRRTRGWRCPSPWPSPSDCPYSRRRSKLAYNVSGRFPRRWWSGARPSCPTGRCRSACVRSSCVCSTSTWSARCARLFLGERHVAGLLHTGVQVFRDRGADRHPQQPVRLHRRALHRRQRRKATRSDVSAGVDHHPAAGAAGLRHHLQGHTREEHRGLNQCVVGRWMVEWLGAWTGGCQYIACDDFVVVRQTDRRTWSDWYVR